MRNQTARVQMEKHLERCKTSGLSRRAYCERYGISYHRFIYWQRKTIKPAEAASFLPVEVMPHIATPKEHILVRGQSGLEALLPLTPDSIALIRQLLS
jgi:hypothetical protein